MTPLRTKPKVSRVAATSLVIASLSKRSKSMSMDSLWRLRGNFLSVIIKNLWAAIIGCSKRDCGGKASGGKFKANSYPLVISASANTTLQGATRVELRWSPGREAALLVPSTADSGTNNGYMSSSPPGSTTVLAICL